MLECCCCFTNDLLLKEVSKCNKGHVICNNCIEMGVKNAWEEKRLLKCFHQSGCNEILDESMISRTISDIVLKTRYSDMCSELAVKTINNLHRCLFCDYAVIIEGESDVFHCIPCSKLYCFKCKDNLHEGTECGQAFHEEAEALTKKHTIQCCGIALGRLDACNHLSCPTCRKGWCNYCKKDSSNNHASCPLYGEPPEPEIIALDKDKAIAERKKARQDEIDQLERERLARIEQERLARIEQERLERERLARIEQERLERIRVEQERLARIERERIEQARLEYERLVRLEHERLERIARLEKERIEAEKFEENVKMLKKLKMESKKKRQSEQYLTKRQLTTNEYNVLIEKYNELLLS
jgi:hypothetical protein